MGGKGAETDRRKELDKDISSYISTRRKVGGGLFKSISGIFKPSDDVNVKLHPEVEEYGKEKEEHKKETKEEMAEEMEELEEEFEEGAKPGFFERIRNMFFESESAGSMEDIPPEEVEKVIEENRKKEEEEAPEEEADTELESEYDEGAREKGIIGRFLERLFGKAGAEGKENVCADEIAETIETVDDMKKVAEISTKVMKMLPPEKVKELKESEDFRNFKDILKKHNLIK